LATTKVAMLRKMLFLIALMLLAFLASRTVRAQAGSAGALIERQHAHELERSTPQYGAREIKRAGGGYFVEFRARRGLTVFGHNYIVYGRLNKNGDTIAPQVVGFSDGDERNTHLSAVRAFVGPLSQDFTSTPTAVYRRQLTATQFEQLISKIRQIRRAQLPYNFVFLNCSDFAGEIAESIGLRRPPSLVSPTAYVVGLRILNGL
jgi:hypothetical protein